MTLRKWESDAYRFTVAARTVAPTGIVTLAELIQATSYRGGRHRLRTLLRASPRLWTHAGGDRWLYHSDRRLVGLQRKERLGYRTTTEAPPLDDAQAWRRWLTVSVARCTAKLVSVATVAALRGHSTATASRHLRDAQRTPNRLPTGLHYATHDTARVVAWELTKEHGGWYFAVGGTVYRRLAYTYEPLGDRRQRGAWSDFARLDIEQRPNETNWTRKAGLQ